MNEKKSSPKGLKAIDFERNQSCLGSATDVTVNSICCPQANKAQVSLPSLEQPFVKGSI